MAKRAWNFVDRTGMRYGKLVCVRPGPSSSNEARWFCLCDCGKETLVQASGLRGGTRSCGCLRATGPGSRPLYKMSSPPGSAARNCVKKSYRLSARYKGLAFELTDNQFDALTSSNCAYCGRAPSLVKRTSRNGSWAFNGIDRIDNAIGYIEGNVAPCCSVCNHAKAAMSLDEFEEWIDDLIKHRNTALDAVH